MSKTTFTSAFDALPCWMRNAQPAVVERLGNGHDLSPRLVGGSQLGPDALPIVRQQVLQQNLRVKRVPASCEGCTGGFEALENLVEVLLVTIQDFSNLVPSFRGVVGECHALNSNRQLELSKPVARFLLISRVK